MISRKYLFVIFLAAFAAASLFTRFTPKSEAVSNIPVKIGVADSVQSGKVIGDGIIFTDAKGKKGSVKNGAIVKASGGGLSVGAAVLSFPVTATAKGPVGWENVKYRGKLTFIKAGSGFTVINELPLEDYVRGILKAEMAADWPFEALKAQAILARTYAVRNRGRFGKRGYDFDAGENSQVYRGVNAESPLTDKAVLETAGMVLTWNGSPADIYYHSDSGGATADAADVWGSVRPYLRVQREAVQYTSPNSTWNTTLSEDQVTSILSKMKQNVGKVLGIDVATVDAAGRAVTLKVTGERGTANVKAHAFRMAAGSRVIKSTNFQISRDGNAPAPRTTPTPSPTTTQTPTPTPKPQAAPSTPAKPAKGDPLIAMIKAGMFTPKELIDMLSYPEKRGDYIKIGYERMNEPAPENEASPNPEPPAAETPVPSPAAPQTSQTGTGAFVFSGRGWGHGVGLSQWGAKAMAEKGTKCGEILGHYFPGTKISK
ncbi:MAG: SpoIID/LytB domain-containing protein [Synergistaceae bacterium]|jgi:stage II sporulation protein D|nr:SpoIID/LytB domain-containing protein [Synergistaceae bacterium]